MTDEELRKLREVLFVQLSEQKGNYESLVRHRGELRGRLEAVEKSIAIIRGHVLSEASDADAAALREQLALVRFVGMRLGDACVQLLEEAGGLTTHEIIQRLEQGGAIFAAGYSVSTIQQVNGVLSRLSCVRRDPEHYEWTLSPSGDTQ